MRFCGQRQTGPVAVLKRVAPRHLNDRVIRRCRFARASGVTPISALNKHMVRIGPHETGALTLGCCLVVDGVDKLRELPDGHRPSGNLERANGDLASGTLIVTGLTDEVVRTHGEASGRKIDPLVHRLQNAPSVGRLTTPLPALAMADDHKEGSSEEDLWTMAPTPTIDAMFRSMQTNHLQLSAIADQKASILVGASTVSMGLIAPLADDPDLPLIMMALTAGLSAGAGVLALLPRLRPTSEHVMPNMLFFGTHSQLTSDEFHREMAAIVGSGAGVYRYLTEDLHQMGNVLARKFRFINVAYGILLVGLVITAITFAIDL